MASFGTPGETRTHYLALRRRTLYPGELRRLIAHIFYSRKYLLSRLDLKFNSGIFQQFLQKFFICLMV